MKFKSIRTGQVIVRDELPVGGPEMADGTPEYQPVLIDEDDFNDSSSASIDNRQ